MYKRNALTYGRNQQECAAKHSLRLLSNLGPSYTHTIMHRKDCLVTIRKRAMPPTYWLRTDLNAATCMHHPNQAERHSQGDPARLWTLRSARDSCRTSDWRISLTTYPIALPSDVPLQRGDANVATGDKERKPEPAMRPSMDPDSRCGAQHQDQVLDEIGTNLEINAPKWLASGTNLTECG